MAGESSNRNTASLLAELKTALLRFTSEELKSKVLQELTLRRNYDEIISSMQERKLPMTKESFVKVLIQDFLARTTSVERLNRKLSLLTVLHVVFHHKTYTWNAFELTEEEGYEYRGAHEIQSALESRFTRLHMIVKVSVIHRDQVLWMCLEEKKRRARAGPQKYPALYLAHFTGTPYIFAKKTSNLPTILKVVSECLGYNDYKDCRFHGKNIYELLGFLRNKESRVLNAQGVLDGDVEYRPGVPRETLTGVDFTKKKDKEEYTDRHFPKEGTFQQLKVTFPESEWMVEDMPQLNGQIFPKIEVTYKSPDLVTMFKEMTKKGIMSAPVPEYVTHSIRSAKNTFELKRANN